MRTAVSPVFYCSSFPALLAMHSGRGNLSSFSTTGGSFCCSRVTSKSQGDVPGGISTRKGSVSELQLCYTAAHVRWRFRLDQSAEHLDSLCSGSLSVCQCFLFFKDPVYCLGSKYPRKVGGWEETWKEK